MNKELEILNQGKELTIKSTELVDIINQFRKVESEASEKKYSELRHADFITKIEKEIKTLKTLGLEAERNFSLGEYLDKNNQSRKCYELNGSGMRMMLNSESTIVRFKTEEYISQLEEKLNESQQFKLPTTYKEALLQLVEQVEQNEKLQLENSDLKEENKLKDLENRLLSGEVFAWADTNLINSLVRTYSSSVYGDFSKGWTDFKKSLLYSHSINLNSRITAYLNKTGKKTKPKTLSLLSKDEIPNALSTIVSMCREEDVDISKNLKHCLEGDK